MLCMRVLHALCSVFLCFLLFDTAGAAAEERLRCTLKLLKEERVKILCDKGSHKEYENQFQLTAISKAFDVLPGVQVFAEASGDGKRALILIKGIRLELYDLQLTQELETLGVTIPVAAVDSEVIIRDSTFAGFSNTSLVGGVYLNNAEASLRNCSFAGSGSEKKPIETGAIRLDESSTAVVSGSTFFNLQSTYAAIVGTKNSSAVIKDATFKKTNGLESAAVLIMNNGGAEISGSSIFSCTSKKRAAISLLNAGKLKIESCDLKMNTGLNGGTVHFLGDKNIDSSETDGQIVHDIVIRDSDFDNNLAKGNGGALYIKKAALLVDGSKLGQNRVCDRGSGLFMEDAPALSIRSSSFEANHFINCTEFYRHSGGGIFASAIRHVEVQGSKIEGNKADVAGGGAFFLNVRRLEVSRTTIKKNRAREKAGFAAQSVRVLIMEHVQFAQNEAAWSAAGLSVSENLELLLKKTTFSSNIAAFESAASIYSSRSVRAEGCQFRWNAAKMRYAGGLYIDAALDVTILKTKFTKNMAPSEGAAVQAKSIDSLYIKESDFLKNSASSGAACDIKQSNDVYIYATTFKMNQATAGSGGAINLEMVDRAFIDDSRFAENRATYDGGAVFVNSLFRLSSKGSRFENNTAELGSGGSIYIREVDNAFLNGAAFRDSSAYMNGGAVSIGSAYNILDIEDSEFESNKAVGREESNGGAIAVSIFSKVAIQRCSFRKNRARNNGGAMNLPHTKRELTRSVDMAETEFEANCAERGSGGAIFFEKSPLFVLNKCKFLSNRSYRDGGAVLIQTGEIVTIERSHFGQNRVLDTDGIKNATEVSLGEKFTHPERGFSRQQTAISYDSANQWNDEQSSADIADEKERAHGGAMAIRKIGNIDISFSTVVGNFAPGRGGGIFVQEVTKMTVYETDLNDNHALTSAGALYMTNITESTLTGSSFQGNSVGRDNSQESKESQERVNGGAFVATQSSNVQLKKLLFVKNQARHYGGAVSFTMVTNVSLDECGFEENRALGGGALLISRSSWGIIDRCVFTKNRGQWPDNALSSGALADDTEENVRRQNYSGHGGAILMEHSSNFNLTSPKFQENEADGDGGAICINATTDLAFFESIFTKNLAKSKGGAISLSFGNVSLSVDHFEHNTAMNGGILSVLNSSLTGLHIQTEKNTAARSGGLVYCVKPSNVSISSSEFTDDGSKGGSAFKADCDCQLSVLESKIVCSNDAADNCGSFGSDEGCNGNVILEAAQVIRYENSWTVVLVIVAAIVILPILVLLAKTCTRCSTKAAHKVGLYNEALLPYSLPEHGPMYDPELLVYRDHEVQRLMSASPMIPPSQSAVQQHFRNRRLEAPVDSATSYSNTPLPPRELLTPFLRTPLEGTSRQPVKKRRSFLRPNSVTPSPLPEYNLPLSGQKSLKSYSILSERLYEEFDESGSPSPSRKPDDQSVQDLYNCMHEQQDIKFEYEDMLLTRSESS